MGEALPYLLVFAIGVLVGMAGMAVVYPCRRIRRLARPLAPRPRPVPTGRTAGAIMHPFTPRD